MLIEESPPLHDGVCFHCQQAAEKYLKAFLQEHSTPFRRTHDLEELLDLAVILDAALKGLRRGLRFLSNFAVDYRYPGKSATKRRSNSAARWAERIRQEIRKRLTLRP